MLNTRKISIKLDVRFSMQQYRMYHHKHLFMQWYGSDDEFSINLVASQQIHNVVMIVLERLRELPSKTFHVQTTVQTTNTSVKCA